MKKRTTADLGTLRGIGYLRASTDQQAESGLSLGAQRQKSTAGLR